MQKLIKIYEHAFDKSVSQDRGHGFTDSSITINVKESSYINKLIDDGWVIKDMISQDNRNSNAAIIMLLEK